MFLPGGGGRGRRRASRCTSIPGARPLRKSAKFSQPPLPTSPGPLRRLLDIFWGDNIKDGHDHENLESNGVEMNQMLSKGQTVRDIVHEVEK